MTHPTPDATWLLDTHRLGRKTLVYDRLDSTNSLALSLANDPAHDGLALLAREQTAGRGQYGRSWLAPPGSSVLLSALLFPPAPLRRPVTLTAWAAVSVCETLFDLAQIDATIKWPNDVLIAGKKICGILIEQRTTGLTDFPLATVVGIGLNVTQSAEMLVQAGLPAATSLAAPGHLFSFDEVAEQLIRQLDKQYDLLMDGAASTLETTWKARIGLAGEVVVVEGVNQTWRGRLLELSFAGLALELPTGEVLRLSPESVRHLSRLSEPDA